MQIDYRRDIDGLRAVAILPVLLFHAGVPGFGGGYVGVDVFFVISGFLITQIIAREIDGERFSILNFYERRARRIMPALMAMIAAVLVAACILYLPGDLNAVPKAAAAATLFVSNLWYFATTGYFAGGAETKPLLHTWSLAVEEQYYIGFPILLILIARFWPRGRTAVVAAIALVSFGWAVATQGKGDGFAFYMLPPRAWELFAGSLLALGAFPDVRAWWGRELLALAGLAAIGSAIFIYDKTTVFPGVTALPPVLGSVAILHAGAQTRVARLLGLSPLVGIGLISYSLYLWHWPVIVFAQYATDAALSGWTSVAAIAGSVLLAVLSWRFVERPFRDRARFGRRAIFGATGAGMVLLCAASAATWAGDGWRSRFSPEVLRMADAATDISPKRRQCHDADPARGRPYCTLGADAAPDAMLWGDSHGVELAYALGELRSMRGAALVQRTRSSCAPVLDAPGAKPACTAANAATLSAIRSDRRIATIYLVGFWAEHADAPLAFWQRLDATIAALVGDGRRVVLVGAVPPAGTDVPRRLAHLVQARALSSASGISRDELRAETMGLRAVAAKWQGRIAYVDPAETYCDATHCHLIENGVPLYFDTHHPSLSGARLLARAIEAQAQLAKE